MSKLIRLTWIPVALALSACDVQVHDQTPAQYPANHDIGMYEIKATAARDTLVTPGSVFMFGLVGDKHERRSFRVFNQRAIFREAVDSAGLHVVPVIGQQGLADGARVEHHRLGGVWSTAASHSFYFFLQSLRVPGMSDLKIRQSMLFYLLFPFQALGRS